MHYSISSMLENDHHPAGPSGAKSRWVERGPAKRWENRNPREENLHRPLMAVTG